MADTIQNYLLTAWYQTLENVGLTRMKHLIAIAPNNPSIACLRHLA
jgi:hypothetical protein